MSFLQTQKNRHHRRYLIATGYPKSAYLKPFTISPIGKENTGEASYTEGQISTNERETVIRLDINNHYKSPQSNCCVESSGAYSRTADRQPIARKLRKSIGKQDQT